MALAVNETPARAAPWLTQDMVYDSPAVDTIRIRAVLSVQAKLIVFLFLRMEETAVPVVALIDGNECYGPIQSSMCFQHRNYWDCKKASQKVI